MGKFGEGEEFGVRSQRTYEQPYGMHSKHTALAYNCLSTVYWKMGRLEEAERFALMNLTSNQEVYGETHSETAASYNNLCLVYADMRDSRRQRSAEESPNKAASVQREPSQHRYDVPQPLSSLPDTGRLEQAERFGVKSLSTYQQFYNDIHPQIALSTGTLARVYQDMGRLEQAKDLARKAVRAYERLTSFNPSDLAQAKRIVESIIKRRNAVSSRK